MGQDARSLGARPAGGLAKVLPSLTVAAWCMRWLAEREAARYRNVKSERVALCTHVLLDAFGRAPLRELGPEVAREWWARMCSKPARVPRQMPKGCAVARPLSASSLRNVLTLIRCALAEAVARGLLASNPTRELAVPRPAHATTALALDDVLEPSEQTALMRELTAMLMADYRKKKRASVELRCVMAMVGVALGAGLRRGELLSMRWSEVVLDDGERPHLVVRFGGRRGAPTKGGRARRVPLFGLSLEALYQWRMFLRMVAPAWCEPERLVFPGPRGGRRKVPPTRTMRAALRAAGVERRVRWHSLRHSCATSLLEGWWGRRWTPPEVQQLLGHASVTTTERYLHARGSLVFRAAREAQREPTSRIALEVSGQARLFDDVSSEAHTDPLAKRAGSAVSLGERPMLSEERACERHEGNATERDTGLESSPPSPLPCDDDEPPASCASPGGVPMANAVQKAIVDACIRRQVVALQYAGEGGEGVVSGRPTNVERGVVWVETQTADSRASTRVRVPLDGVVRVFSHAGELVAEVSP